MASPESSAIDWTPSHRHPWAAGRRLAAAVCMAGALLVLTACTTTQPPREDEAATQENETATVVELAPDAPDRYVVRSGDTVWVVASRFLRDPWQWEAVWRPNPVLEDPDHLYPGDVLTLAEEAGRPVIRVTGGPRLGQGPAPGHAAPRSRRGMPTVKVEPHVRVEPIAREVERVPIGAIIAFLVRPVVMDRQALKRLPYLVGGEDNRLVYGFTDTLYATGLPGDTPEGAEFHLIRPEGSLYAEDTGDYLGEKTLHVGVATVIRSGDPATLNFRLSTTEALPGDRLVRLEPRPTADYFPHPPRQKVKAHVVALSEALSQVGALQVVVLDKGKTDGLDRGAVLAVYNASEQVIDPHGQSWRRLIRLPAERAGLILVYAALDQVSYAIVMRAKLPIKEGFVATNP